jgi:hypothetical protein
MSRDYFGALMRSSGLAVGGATPIVSPRAEAPMTLEAEGERPAPRAEVSAWPTVIEAPRAAPQSPMPGVLPALDAPAERAEPTRQAVASDVPVSTPSPTMSITTKAMPPVPEPDAAGPPQAPVTAQALVRAAMQWVAAGPHDVRTKSPVANEPKPQEATRVRSADALRGQRSPARDESPRSHPGREDASSAPGAALPALATRPLFPQPATLRPESPAAASPRNDTVEVSIGAIHVRVDAPATQTVARTPPQPPTPRAANAPRPERGALSRRALRRI